MKKKIIPKFTVRNFKFKYFEKFFLYIALCIVTVSSLITLYDQKYKIKSKLSSLITKPTYEKSNENDLLWAKRLMNGGYILHFRHAERDKWIDVINYDSLDSHVASVFRYNWGAILLFDIENDPLEEHDLAASQPAVVAELLASLVQYNASLSPSTSGPRVTRRSCTA